MTLFLNGGGSAEQVKESYRLLTEKLDMHKPLLYVPLAMEKQKYSACFQWITSEMSEYHFAHIDMITSADELADKNFHEY